MAAQRSARISSLFQKITACVAKINTVRAMLPHRNILDTHANVRQSYGVTTTISSKGQLVIPRPVRERHKFRPGDDFLLFELSNGDILLRRIRRPKKSLAWHMRRLQGVKIEHNREPVRELDW